MPPVIRLFLCGDVMTGRGIDQILPHPGDPSIFEPGASSAASYVALAEARHGPIARPVAPSYVWGDALAAIRTRTPGLRIVNLETSVTANGRPVPKGINYRMHPANIDCLRAARIDCCVLANNHVGDWGESGLLETVTTLRSAGIATAGAGGDLAEASRPAVLQPASSARVLVFGLGCATSGVPEAWAAARHRPGLWYLPDLGLAGADRVSEHILRERRPGDTVIVSVHWGGNWGYDIPADQREFARRLIASGAADLVHGHSSHHPKGMGVYRERLVLYGCGDLINDYEGIRGYEHVRPDLVLAYFADLEPGTGRFLALEMVPFRARGFRLEAVPREDAEWIAERLGEECAKQGTGIELGATGSLVLRWS